MWVPSASEGSIFIFSTSTVDRSEFSSLTRSRRRSPEFWTLFQLSVDPISSSRSLTAVCTADGNAVLHVDDFVRHPPWVIQVSDFRMYSSTPASAIVCDLLGCPSLHQHCLDRLVCFSSTVLTASLCSSQRAQRFLFSASIRQMYSTWRLNLGDLQDLSHRSD